MCTVTYFPNPRQSGSFTVTDSRDELERRRTAPPAFYRDFNTLLYYPKDLEKGGTWMGLSENRRLICLLNGAFGWYEKLPYYRESRGIVVKELLAADSFQSAVEHFDFQDIEPFFCLVFEWRNGLKLWELAWDSERLFLSLKDETKPAIWSSSRLYSMEQHAKKKGAFDQLLEVDGRPISADVLWDFHHTKETTGTTGLIIDRGNLKTTSVSQFHLSSQDEGIFHFQDLVSGKEVIARVLMNGTWQQ